MTCQILSLLGYTDMVGKDYVIIFPCISLYETSKSLETLEAVTKAKNNCHGAAVKVTLLFNGLVYVHAHALICSMKGR